MNSLESYKTFIKYIGFLLGPLVFFIILSMDNNEAMSSEIWKVLAVALWMVIWWVTEAIPIPVTALLPIILLPLLGIFNVGEATAPYASSIIFLFMGGFMIALGLEKHNLHQRIALNLVRLTGTSGNGIILGFMLATALLSMWISNTATAVMMLPIATSVIGTLTSDNENNANTKKFALGLMISIAYAANLGGTMTIIGTPPNVVMVGYLKSLVNYNMEFSRWLMIGIPIGFTLLSLTYLLITKILFVNNLKHVESTGLVIKGKLGKLGVISKEEKLVIFIFGLTAFLWIFKQQVNSLIGTDLMNDTITAMAGGILMFITPSDLSEKKFILDWEDTQKLPWGILILFGGGMCLAKSMEKVGIIQLVGEYVSSYGYLHVIVIILIITAIVLFLTELMSNVALVTIFIPVIIGIAEGLHMDPLLMVIPATIASSCAFMMPISTPPNAIVFASGHIKIKDMMRAGFFLNLISIFILTFASMTLIKWVFS